MCRIFSGQPPERYEPITRRLRLNGHSTSIRLERGFWDILDRMAAREGVTTPVFISRLHDEVLDLHGAANNFASLLRCACLTDVTQQSTAPAYAMAAE
ncbi:ribbon-helix-helix domain-containing protein [Rubellimicrobium rubrum]|uniref:Ribbon-helix-helix domain-containing protein n=1 Tax=Rubellimicrobium rubrum TaxID=2585369 RepID=A0A5C4MSU1_9RHOB|nr:ribbon-helix-helix domain-containing protein [Rubellimicrobium rubrum]TNC46870.1 ribbon-helix-helix domain-containing protein [Rubellimicrobium rubrum]